MTPKLKARLLINSRAHVLEFGDCEGIVQGLTDYNVSNESDPTQFGPEVDVRWQPSDIRFCYLPEDLEELEVVGVEIPCSEPTTP